MIPTFTARSSLVTSPTRKHVRWDVFVGLRENPMIMTLLLLLAYDIDLNASVLNIIPTDFQYSL